MRTYSEYINERVSEFLNQLLYSGATILITLVVCYSVIFVSILLFDIFGVTHMGSVVLFGSLLPGAILLYFIYRLVSYMRKDHLKIARDYNHKISVSIPGRQKSLEVSKNSARAISQGFLSIIIYWVLITIMRSWSGIGEDAIVRHTDYLLKNVSWLEQTATLVSGLFLPESLTQANIDILFILAIILSTVLIIRSVTIVVDNLLHSFGDNLLVELFGHMILPFHLTRALVENWKKLALSSLVISIDFILYKQIIVYYAIIVCFDNKTGLSSLTCVGI